MNAYEFLGAEEGEFRYTDRSGNENAKFCNLSALRVWRQQLYDEVVGIIPDYEAVLSYNGQKLTVQLP
jgi:hypothetical protein